MSRYPIIVLYQNGLSAYVGSKRQENVLTGASGSYIGSPPDRNSDMKETITREIAIPTPITILFCRGLIIQQYNNSGVETPYKELQC